MSNPTSQSNAYSLDNLQDQHVAARWREWLEELEYLAAEVDSVEAICNHLYYRPDRMADRIASESNARGAD